ncbi:MAG: L-cystine ABC transporter ATP-binding protein YecC [Sandaracinaceae bacterium]
MSEAVISVEKLVKKYGERTVLKGVSFDIPAGQVVALVGPSGGGKSTALRCMTGLEPFQEGAVRVGRAKLSPGPLAKHKHELQVLRLESGLVFQSWHLFPHMTALENVYEAPVHVKKVPLEVARNKARVLLEKVGLSHRENAMPRNMSGGEQQRCAIARALAMEPKVLFMDEPTSALDPQRVGDLVELLDHLKTTEKLTFVIVTHEMKFAEKLADRALVLYEGNVIEDGHPRKVLASPKDPRTRTFLGLDEG